MGFKNIIKSIFKKPDKNAYKDGYEWAKQELANKRHPEQIEAYIHGSSDPFDLPLFVSL